MRIAFMGVNYCGQYDPVPPPHESLWLPFAPTLEEMYRNVGKTPDWPDVCVVVLAETHPLPLDMERSQCPTVGIVVDWETWSDAIFAHAAALDFILSDQSGVDRLDPILPGKLRTFVPVANFSQISPPEAVAPLRDRPHDITFIGRIFPPEIFADRNRALSWLVDQVDACDVRIMSGLDAAEFPRAMCASKIVFNHAASRVQAGVNARNFEGGACRAVMMGESDNAGVTTFFGEDELLRYNVDTLPAAIRGVLDDLDAGQRLADRYAAKTTVPLMPRLMDALHDLLATKPPPRTGRTPFDILSGLCHGFGNWGSAARRPSPSLGMMVAVAENVLGARSVDPALLNLVGVCMAEVAVELARLGEAESSADIMAHPILAPERHWLRAAEMDECFPVPLYNLGRYLIKRGQDSRALRMLTRARSRIEQYGEDAMRLPSAFFPVWCVNATGLDRVLTGAYNGVPFQYPDVVSARTRKASLLRWRIEEALGDLARRRGNTPEAARMYRAAVDAAPTMATEALRKIVDIAKATDDRAGHIEALRELVALNPLDASSRRELLHLCEPTDPEHSRLAEEIRRLHRAVPTPRLFERPPFDEL